MLNDVRSAFSDDPISHPTDDSPLDSYSRAVTAVVDRVGPAVVRVASTAEGHGRVRRAHIGIAAQTVPLPRRVALALGAGRRAVCIAGWSWADRRRRPASGRATYCCRSMASRSPGPTTSSGYSAPTGLEARRL
jgi:hypothetical protein